MALIDNLAAYGKLDEASANAIDSHSNGLTLTDTNTAGSAAGKINTGRQFDRASNRYFTRASESLLRIWERQFSQSVLGQFSINLDWSAQLVAKRNSSSSREVEISLNGVSNKIAFELFGSSSTTIAIVTTAAAVSAGPWFHIVARHGQHLDQPKDQRRCGGNRVPDVGTAEHEFNSVHRWQLASGTSTTAADAIIDELAIRKRTLSDAEVTAVATAAAGRLAYPFASGGVGLIGPGLCGNHPLVSSGVLCDEKI